MDQKQEDIFRRIESALDQWAATIPRADAGQSPSGVASPALDDLTRNVRTAWEAMRDLLGHVSQWEESATRLRECLDAVRELQSWAASLDQRLASQMKDLRQDLARLIAITSDLSRVRNAPEAQLDGPGTEPAPPASTQMDIEPAEIPIPLRVG